MKNKNEKKDVVGCQSQETKTVQPIKYYTQQGELVTDKNLISEYKKLSKKKLTSKYRYIDVSNL